MHSFWTQIYITHILIRNIIYYIFIIIYIYLYSHFESEGHNGFLEDVSITLIDKTDGSNPTKRETFWMHTLKTLAPYVLNVENGI